MQRKTAGIGGRIAAVPVFAIHQRGAAHGCVRQGDAQRAGGLAIQFDLLHLVGHGVTKITLFFCAGAIDVHTHRERVSELTGIGRQMPVTMAAFTLASLSMVGIPPFVIFGSKWLLGSGAAQVDQPVFLIVYMVSGVLSAAYLLPIVYRAYWRTSPAFPRFGEASWLMVTPLSLTAVLALALGIAPNLPFGFLDMASDVARSVFAGAP